MSSPPARSASRARSTDPVDKNNAPDTTRSPTRPANGTTSRSPSRSPARRDSNTSMRSHSRSPSRRGRTLSRSPPPPPAAAARSTKIVIEKLTKNIQTTHLHEIFARFGSIAELEMPVNKHLMTNKGIAYILYETTAEAEEAIASMHEAQLDGAVVNVSIVLPRRRFSRSPERRRPPPDRFGEPHRYGRDGGRGGGRGGMGVGMGGDRSYRPGAGGGAYGGGGYRDRSPLPRYGGGGRGGRGGGGGAGFRDERSHYRPSYSRSPPPRRTGRRSPSYGYSRSRSPRRSLSGSPPPRRRFASPPRRGGGGGRRSPSYDSFDSRRSRSMSRDRSPSRDRGGRRR